MVTKIAEMVPGYCLHYCSLYGNRFVLVKRRLSSIEVKVEQDYKNECASIIRDAYTKRVPTMNSIGTLYLYLVF